MIHATNTRALKALLLGSATLVTLGLQPSISQERGQLDRAPSAQSPSAQPDARPSPRENRSQQAPRAQERGTTGQASPSVSQPDQATPRAQERDGEAKPSKGDRTQSRDGDRARDNQAQPRDAERNRSQARDRDADRNRNQAQDRDADRGRNQAQDRDRRRDRDQARDRDSDRARNRDQVRDNDRGQDRDAARTNERRAAQPTEQQRTRISTSIQKVNVQPVRNVNFSLSVGTVLPASVRFYPVTPAIVEVYPQYRGYQFVLVEDDIVIVEPRSRKIVTVIDEGGSGRAAARSRGKLTLSDKQRDVIRRSAIERRTTGSATATTTIDREYVIGDDLPESIEFESFPETIYTEVPEIRSYRYVVRDRDVYVVDPSERRVIEIIR
ncbi:DUF1236 domain-containing protein [Pseudorhodoplanes sp.]|uniref:DUF1236 domain-containing protein n=1 Tax=Pseudorhodoplanes sp. TaxID=1934341 RepID=UPI002BBDA397|nr:DUF1236 domain-containing protein [Pseudorhodoplanes sp.]HWV54573.1 DUF1236 domain-containing protein [Pseudorhodoplanes sp.]